MKVQYFGDVSDYRKFALLRLLATVGGFRIGVCWMLTENDGRGTAPTRLPRPNGRARVRSRAVRRVDRSPGKPDA